MPKPDEGIPSDESVGSTGSVSQDTPPATTEQPAATTNQPVQTEKGRGWGGGKPKPKPKPKPGGRRPRY